LFFEKASPEIPPGLPLPKGGEFFYRHWKNDSAFPPSKKGDEGGFNGFSKN
jgi:hypothetical protein